jgi:hypothetical protein
MHSTTIFTSLLTIAIAGLATAAPVIQSRDNTTYYGVSLSIQTSSGMDPDKVSSPAAVEINNLTLLNGDAGVSASEISFDGIASNVDINTVECRAYKDADGVQPGSAPFNATSPAYLSTNLVTVGSILCYIVGEN